MDGRLADAAVELAPSMSSTPAVTEPMTIEFCFCIVMDLQSKPNAVSCGLLDNIAVELAAGANSTAEVAEQEPTELWFCI